MKSFKLFILGILMLSLVPGAYATERVFTYTYEPETMPQGAFEVEQWVTLRAGRNRAVGQEEFRQFDFRESMRCAAESWRN